MGQNTSKTNKKKTNSQNEKKEETNNNNNNYNNNNYNNEDKNKKIINLKNENSKISNNNNSNQQNNTFESKYLKKIKVIKQHSDWIKSVKIFPSGNIISVSDDETINIYNKNTYELIQKIKNAHLDDIIYIDIKDENNFVTCSYDKTIKTWIKKIDKFELNYKIEKAHNNDIYCVLYYNENLISCSQDNSIKIWEYVNFKYQLLTKIIESNDINSMLLLKDKNILISSGYDGTTFYKIYENGLNINFICNLKEAFGGCWNGIYRINDNKIIVGGEKYLYIILINEKKIFQEIRINFRCNGICYNENKKILLVGGWGNDILIYKGDNFEFVERFENAHFNYIIGFCKMENNLVLSFSGDWRIIIWSIK